MDKKHEVVRRLVIITAVVLSLVSSCCGAQSGARLCHPGTDNCLYPTPDDPSPEIVCIPGTSNCKPQHKDSVIALPSPTDGASKFKAFDTCDPKTQLCQGTDPPSFDASGNEDQDAGASDQSKNESSEESQSQSPKGHKPEHEMMCTGLPDKDHHCPDPPRNSLVSESGEDDFAKDDAYGESQSPEESNSEYEPSPEAGTSKYHKPKPTNLMICRGPPDHRICTDPPQSSFVSDDASADSRSSEESESESDTSKGHEPTPPNGRMSCTGLPDKDKNCSDPPHPKSFVSESNEDAFAINIHQEKDTINPLVCHPTADGTTCEEPHHAFRIAQPRVEAA